MYRASLLLVRVTKVLGNHLLNKKLDKFVLLRANIRIEAGALDQKFVTQDCFQKGFPRGRPFRLYGRGLILSPFGMTEYSSAFGRR